MWIEGILITIYIQSQVPNISIEEGETINRYHSAIQDNSKLLTEIRGNVYCYWFYVFIQ